MVCFVLFSNRTPVRTRVSGYCTFEHLQRWDGYWDNVPHIGRHYRDGESLALAKKTSLAQRQIGVHQVERMLCP